MKIYLVDLFFLEGFTKCFTLIKTFLQKLSMNSKFTSTFNVSLETFASHKDLKSKQKINALLLKTLKAFSIFYSFIAFDKKGMKNKFP
jgi:hypothetical protein